MSEFKDRALHILEAFNNEFGPEYTFELVCEDETSVDFIIKRNDEPYCMGLVEEDKERGYNILTFKAGFLLPTFENTEDEFKEFVNNLHGGIWGCNTEPSAPYDDDKLYWHFFLEDSSYDLEDITTIFGVRITFENLDYCQSCIDAYEKKHENDTQLTISYENEE